MPAITITRGGRSRSILIIEETPDGYVSHSFNQFVRTDGRYLYRLDHGDAYPRAVVITKADVADITDCDYKFVLPIEGGIGDNDTGVSAGGLELAGNHLVAVGNSVP